MPHPLSFTDPFISLQVALPLAGGDVWDYLVSASLPLKRGSLVRVSFRRHSYEGIVVGFAPSSLPQEKLKSVHTLLPLPPLPESMCDFMQWVADYTVTPLGQVVPMVIPDIGLFSENTASLRYVLNPHLPETLTLTQKRRDVIQLMQDNAARTYPEIMEQTGVGRDLLKKLTESDVLLPVELSALPAMPLPWNPALATLSPLQQQAVAQLRENCFGSVPKVTLLDGVTGSGKTEVYCQLIADILAQPTGQVLLLLPEISLTAQMLTRLGQRLGGTPATWHSGMTAKEKRDVWHGVLHGSTRLIVGARSALFLPFQHLKLIIIDEEHEPTFKQEEGVIYHARDMAVVRGHLAKIPVVLSSATPSIETLYNVEQKKFERIVLPSRHGDAHLPTVKLIDLRTDKGEKHHWIAPELRKALATNLANHKQSLLFLNRRGYAPLLLCRSCRERIMCPDCSAWLVFHKARNDLQCHQCGFNTKAPDECPKCHEKDTLIPCGPGVERIEEEVHAFLPEARTLIMTRDTVADVAAASDALTEIAAHNVDIIIGTQMIAKGLHFPSLTVVGVIDADIGLTGGDLRAAERTYQLLHQVSGRAGRESDRGTVYLQTYAPENVIMQALLTTDRDNFMATEMQGRRAANMPPFSRLVGIVLSSLSDEEVRNYAHHLVRSSPHHKNAQVLGPVPAPYFMLRKRFRYRILVKVPRKFPVQSFIKTWLLACPTPKGVRLKIDVDPYHFL